MSAPATCATADHEATKRTLLDFLWRNNYIGIQFDEAETLVLANCQRCLSTLAYSANPAEW